MYSQKSQRPLRPTGWISSVAICLSLLPVFASAQSRDYRGLWVGQVTLNYANEVTVPLDEDNNKNVDFFVLALPYEQITERLWEYWNANKDILALDGDLEALRVFDLEKAVRRNADGSEKRPAGSEPSQTYRTLLGEPLHH